MQAESALTDLTVRFIIGGIVVSAFSLIGSLFKPATFAGIFGAAPSIALATLGLTFHKDGGQYVSIEGRSMIAGAVGLLAYSLLLWLLVKRVRLRVLLASVIGLPAWFIVSLGLWWVAYR